MKTADESIKNTTIIYVSRKGEKGVRYNVDVIAEDDKTKTLLITFDKLPHHVVIHEKRRIQIKKVVLTTPNTLIVKYSFTKE